MYKENIIDVKIVITKILSIFEIMVNFGQFQPPIFTCRLYFQTYLHVSYIFYLIMSPL